MILATQVGIRIKPIWIHKENHKGLEKKKYQGCSYNELKPYTQVFDYFHFLYNDKDWSRSSNTLDSLDVEALLRQNGSDMA